MTFIDGRPNTCTVTLEIPWEVAEALVRSWPSIIGAMQIALNDREDDRKSADTQRIATQKQCQSNITMWKTQAADLHAEVARRANGPGQKKSIVKQLAAERRMQLSFVQQIMRAFPDEQKVKASEIR